MDGVGGLHAFADTQTSPDDLEHKAMLTVLSNPYAVDTQRALGQVGDARRMSTTGGV